MSRMDTALHRLVERIAAAAADHAPLRLRGGGSKDFYGGALQGELLETTGYAGITSYEPSELVVSARAGTKLAELEALLAESGQCLPFEPPHFAPGSTVGGMVAAGLAGPARANAGAVRDFILGVSIVNGRAEHLSFGGTVMKNVAGYDVSRLMAGALGTLGLITDVHLKVLPIAPAEATLRFECSQAEALERLHGWGGQPLPLNASCWTDEGGTGGALFVRLRGAVAAVQAACLRMGGEQLGPPEATGVHWTALRNHTRPWFTERAPGWDLWRLSVPQTAPVLDLPRVPLIEWHGGQRWLKALPQEAAQIRTAAQKAGGSATLFAADAVSSAADDVPARACFDALQPPLDRIHLALKQEFDPAGIFNRGRLYPQF